MKKGPIASLSLCVGAALLFNGGIYFIEGQQKALEFLTGYTIEWSLSIDNLLVFFLIFSNFKVNATEQYKILSWGVLGAQLMRLIFIVVGVALLKHYGWVMYVFGVFLVYSGIKIFFKSDKSKGIEDNFLFRLLQRFIPKNFSAFLLVLIAVEVADLIFAVDSIPAVLAVTKDPFIVYSSNIFAILGLRAMYFVFAPIFDMFHNLHYALGILLIFIGAKMLTEHWWHMPVGYALGSIAMVLFSFIFASIMINKNKVIQ